MIQDNQPIDYNLIFEKSNGLSYYISRALIDHHGILVVFTTRQHGESQPPYSSLNLAFHVGDNQEHVIKNRKRLIRHFDLDPRRVVCAEQVHGTKVAFVEEEDAGKGAFSLEDSIKGVDALITSATRVPLALFFADCVPIILVEPRKRVVSVMHAGWRGVYGNIVDATISSLISERQVNPEDMLAFIGPSIGGCCYQVGTDLKEKFTEKFNEIPGWISHDRIDLRELAKAQLIASGLKNSKVHGCNNCCTSCRPDVFFSYRADSGMTGRQSAVAVILSD